MSNLPKSKPDWPGKLPSETQWTIKVIWDC